ncbi:MAG: hypothetical protein ACREBG_22935 [Pyrinomonadaceae bacterium]
MTEQPKWKLIANLGDASPLEHGGYFVFEDETGVYPPEAELLVVPDEESEENETSCDVFRFSLDRCKMKQGYLVPFGYQSTWPHALSQYEEWFARDLEGVASCMDSDEETLQDQFCSVDSLERAQAYRAIGDYHGFENLDGYPLRLTSTEVKERYRHILED